MNNINGLQKLKKDRRDITLGQVITLPDLSEIPKTFLLQPFKIKKQIDFQGNNTDFCTAFATTSASELQENVELSPEWSFAVSKIGNLETWGQNLRDACKIHIKYGALEKKDSPYSLENKTADFVRNIANWPDLYDKALPHKKKSFVYVEGQYQEPFDNIKATIWHFRNEKRGVMLGLLWGWPLSDIWINSLSKSGFGHAVLAIGFTSDYLIIQNSYGEETGDKGLHYVHRDVINKNFNNYGGFVFIDMSAEDLKKEVWTLQQKLLDLLYRLLRLFQKQIEPEIKKEPEINTEPEIKKEEIKYKWDTKEEAKKSVKLICNEEGLSASETELICAVINCESGFDTKIINKNKNGTFDYGICQYNSRWYVGKDKPIPNIDTALNNPEFCVRIMIQQYKKGRIKDWVCYKTGKYKLYV